MRRWFLLIALAMLGCESAPPRREPTREHYVLSRLRLDELTEVGHLLEREPSLATQLGIVLTVASCDGAAPVLVDLVSERPDAGGQLVGTLTMLVGVVEEGDPCDGTGVFSILEEQSFGPDGAPLVTGPLYLQGRTGEARVPLARLHAALAALLPTWWTVTARRSAADVLRDAEARTVWPAHDLANVVSERNPELTLLDEIVGLGAQPDVDVDGDGLERLSDETGDGHVDRCTDGQGEPWDGTACVADGRFADGFDLALRFRLVPATLMER